MRNMRVNFRHSVSIPGTSLPVDDGIYQGTWIGTRVTIPFDTFDINFQVEESAGGRTRAVYIKIHDGQAVVEEKY